MLAVRRRGVAGGSRRDGDGETQFGRVGRGHCHGRVVGDGNGEGGEVGVGTLLASQAGWDG